MRHLLDNIVWHALSGPQLRFSAGAGDAKRYAAGFSPIVGFADQAHPNFEALRPHCAAGEHFYCDGWTGAPPPGWSLEGETTMFKMVWDAPSPEIASESLPWDWRICAARSSVPVREFEAMVKV